MVRTITIDTLSNPEPVYRSCVASPDPIFISANGKEQMVLLNCDTYHKLLGRLQIYQALEEGERAIAAGDTMDAFEHLETLRSRCRA